jgi:hypothetical protein
MTYLLNMPLAAGLETYGAVGFLVIFAAVAFIAFKLLKRTVKMAFRLAIVGIILVVAIAGSIALWAFGTGSSERPATRPANHSAR